MTADPGGVYLQNKQFTLSVNISFPILLTVYTFFSPLLTGLLDNSNNEVNWTFHEKETISYSL